MSVELDNLIKVINDLLIDIKAMNVIPDDSGSDSGHWFGSFSEYEIISDDEGAIVEWPNLAILLGQLEEAIDQVLQSLEIEKQQQIAEIQGKMIEHG